MSLEVSALRATAHPIRLRMLSLLTGNAMSAAEIGRELDITQANASYHLRLLAGAGLVEEAGQESVRGGIAKRYIHPWEREASSEPDPEDRLAMLQAMAHEMIRRGQRQVEGRQHRTDAEVWVEPEVWEQALELAHQASDLLHGQAKPPRTTGTLQVNATLALFPMSGENGQGQADEKGEAQ